jgi:hypothetical protein
MEAFLLNKFMSHGRGRLEKSKVMSQGRQASNEVYVSKEAVLID